MNMKRCLSITWMPALALVSVVGLTACSSSNNDVEEPQKPTYNGNVVYDEQGKAGVKPEFVLSFPQSVVRGETRMSDAVTQNLGTTDQFRGMDHIRLIPFAAAPTATSDKLGSIMGLSSISSTALKKPGELNYKVYADQFIPITTKYFLFYGKAIDNTAETDITTMEDKFKYGVVKATGLTEATFTNPGGISFNLEQINTSSDEQANNTVGRAIVQLMTALANTTSGATAPNNLWSTTDDPVLSKLYTNFIGTTVSSSNSVAVILSMLYYGLERVAGTAAARPLADNIKTAILSACTTAPTSGAPASLKSDYVGYPANIGLPDGAVRVRWDIANSEFVDMTSSYGQKMKMGLTDYVYPAALWYYVNTPIKASNAVESVNYDTQSTWANVINNVYSGADTEVGAATLSVALDYPVEYAVGRIETKIAMGTGTFYDGNGKEVDTGSGYALKGLLIGGQNHVTYDFSSVGAENRTIYDSNITNSLIAKPGTTTAVNQTLALETAKDQIIYAALELVNNGADFVGADGIIPAGGTFYLTTELNPKTATNYASGTLDKIVMKDHMTKLTVTIKNGNTFADRGINGNPPDGIPDVYLKDGDGIPYGVDANNDGVQDPYDIDGDGRNDDFITDTTKGGPGWDTDGDGYVDIPVLPDPKTGIYPTAPNVPEGLGKATNGIPDLSSPGKSLGTSVDLKWETGLIFDTEI